jgi:hypothetical protein
MPTVDEAWALVASPLENLRVDAINQPDLPWTERRDRFHSELTALTTGPFVDQLVNWLNDMSETDRQALLPTEQLPTEAYQLLTRIVVDTGAAASDTATAYDETAWFAYLAENGARWDGTAESWDKFRDWFVYDATNAGFQAPATLLFDYLGKLATADRITMFAQYGVTIRPPAPAVSIDPRVKQIMDDLLTRKPAYADIPEARRIELVTAMIEREEAGQ